jgi:hypothetical protein
MDEIVKTALDCGMWVYGAYLRDELSGVTPEMADLAGSELNITCFLGHYGETVQRDGMYMIRGHFIRARVSHVDLSWWLKMYKPVLTCDSFYRSRHVWLGSTTNVSTAVPLTMRKCFKYIGLPFSENGLDLVYRGWTPITAPDSVMRAFRNRLKLLLYFGLGLPLDLTVKIVSHI